MNITILNVSVATVPTAKGSYQVADIAYKNNSFQGKVEGKKIMSFGATKNSFGVLSIAQPGDSFEIEVVKNDKGYNDWVSATKGGAVASTAAPVAAGKAANASPRSTYETPEERAQRQVLIVRQSSLASAASVLTAGVKTPPDGDAVISLAKRFEAYVFGTEPAVKQDTGPTGFDDLPDFDIPQVD